MKRIVPGVIAAALCCSAYAQEKFEVKVAEFVGAQHFMSKWLVGWGEKLEKASGGRLAFKHFAGATMAPVPGHYDLAASGRAEVSWFLHGATPGRFPLTELTHLPYVVGSAEIGTKVINDAQLRGKYLDAEHKGVKVLLLLTHQPGNIHTTKKPVRTTDDMRGLRLRPASPTIGSFITALGGTPVGIPLCRRADGGREALRGSRDGRGARGALDTDSHRGRRTRRRGRWMAGVASKRARRLGAGGARPLHGQCGRPMGGGRRPPWRCIGRTPQTLARLPRRRACPDPWTRAPPHVAAGRPRLLRASLGESLPDWNHGRG